MSKENIKVLLVTNTLYPGLNANSKIVYTLADVLRKEHGCEVFILGERNNGAETADDSFGENAVAVSLLSRYRKIFSNGYGFFGRLKRLVSEPGCFRLYLKEKFSKGFNEDDLHREEYAYEIGQVIKQKEIGCVIGFSQPVYILQALSELDPDVPVITYKLDPWFSHYQNKDKPELKFEEKAADAKAFAICTTKLICRDYMNEPAFSEITGKVHAAEFPNLVRQEKDPEIDPGFDPEKINCVFTGYLYSDIRDPEYVFEFFKELEPSGAVLHIFGGHDSGLVLENEKLPDNVVYHGETDSDTAMAYMNAADILVNIGNTVPNQMPSKIITYISTGIPILNFTKLDNCPTLEYTERYPLALSIRETEEPRREDIEAAKAFIRNSRGKRIPFGEIEKEYYDCTPQYAGKQLYGLICDAVKKQKS